METLGVWLSQAREAKGSTLADAEAATRIRPRFLELLEAGNFAALPGGDMQARGYLRIYARYLGLSPDEVLTRYDAEVRGAEFVGPSGESALGGTERPGPPTPAVPPPPRQGFSVFAAQRRGGTLQTLMAVGGAIIIALVLAVWGWRYVSRGAGERAEATVAAPEPSEATSAPAAADTPAVPAASPTFPADSESGVSLTLEATEHVWVRVTTDGQRAFQGLMAPEQPQTWSGQGMIVVETGNGAGLLVTVNDQLQGRIGARGRVSRRAWGPGGEVAVPSTTPVPTL